MSLWLSQRDCEGFFAASLTAPVAKDGTLVAYACSNNDSCMFDLNDSCRKLGYWPRDNSAEFGA